MGFWWIDLRWFSLILHGTNFRLSCTLSNDIDQHIVYVLLLTSINHVVDGHHFSRPLFQIFLSLLGISSGQWLIIKTSKNTVNGKDKISEF